METLTLRAVSLPQKKADFSKEAAGFKPPSDQHPIGAVKTISPESSEWRFLGMDSRLEAVPSLKALILSGKARLVYTDTATSTCEEKARAAGIHPDSIVKAISCRDAFTGEKYLIVAPGKGRLKLSGIIGEHVEGASIQMESEPPPGMMHGTCTPFVTPEAMAGFVFIAIESPDAPRKGKRGRGLGPLRGLEADVSIGGTDQTAHHLSVRIGYGELVEALVGAYPGKVKIIDGVERT